MLNSEPVEASDYDKFIHKWRSADDMQCDFCEKHLTKQNAWLFKGGWAFCSYDCYWKLA
jgi:hypothetical protein